jgi:hypothetical protein
MAMMMMSQAQDRDERLEEREERRQEFRLQVEMQRQQMQNQQNMMAMIMMSMMGRNASGSVQNDGVVNMFAGIVVLNSAMMERVVTAIPKSSIRLILKNI